MVQTICLLPIVSFSNSEKNVYDPSLEFSLLLNTIIHSLLLILLVLGRYLLKASDSNMRIFFSLALLR